MTPVLKFDNVVRAFKYGVPVLNGVSFSMQAGEVVGLLGRNGSGKTTLINIAMGLLFPQGGSVQPFGLSPTEDPVEVKRRVGYVSEEQVLPAGSSIRRVDRATPLSLFPRGTSNSERELLDRFQLAPGARIGKLEQGTARTSGAAMRCLSPSGTADPRRTCRRTRPRRAPREFLETVRFNC